MAETATAKLYRLLPDQGQLDDPASFYAAVADIFEEFPADVVMLASDGAKGIPSRWDRPTLQRIKAFCEGLYAPIKRAEARADAERSASNRPPPMPPRTPEEQVRRKEFAERMRRECGVPEGGYSRRKAPANPDRKDLLAHHVDALRANLEARAAGGRNEGEPSEQPREESANG